LKNEEEEKLKRQKDLERIQREKEDSERREVWLKKKEEEDQRKAAELEKKKEEEELKRQKAEEIENGVTRYKQRNNPDDKENSTNSLAERNIK